MTTYSTASDIVMKPDSRLVKQARGALLKLANDIRDEADTVAYHSLRLRWAQRVWQGPDFALASALAYLALEGAIRTAFEANPTEPNVTDAAVEAIISAALPEVIAETF